MHPLLSALWVGCLTNSQPQQGEYFLVDDIQVPVEFRRHASPLGAVSFTDKSRLWPMGRVNYYVDPAAMDTHDPRILGAVAHWEEHTCIRFHKCGSMSSCGPTFILFTSDGTGCNSPLGLRPDGVNRINLRFDCGLGNAIHEIAHSLGLHHEQSRNDRDSYVAVDYGQVKQGYTHNFDKTGAYGRDVGPYDYASIMHYNPASFTIGSSPSIVSPRQIGQRDGLSEGDIAAIHFLYNTCSDQFAAPKCSVSRDTARVVLVPHSKVFEVEFNAEYSRGATMTVSYAATTAPNHVASVVEGVVADSAKTKVSFTPSALQAGSTYVLAATFSANNGGGATTCEVSVKVAASDVVCFGVASDDPAVCSGRGMCTADPLHPCQCYSNFGGLECQGYATCSDNFVFSFDDADSLSHWHFDAGLDTTMSVSGGASAMFTGAGYTQPKPRGIFTKVSYHVAFSTTASVSFRGVNGVECWSVYLTSTTITLQATGVQRADITPTPRTWYFIEHVMDPVSNALTLRVDGTTYGNPLFVKHGSTCDVSGVELVAVFGQPDQPAWLDEMHLYCHSFVSMDGSLANPEQSDFTDGGLTLTIAIDGSDTWVDTPATKRALIDGFTSSYPSPSGWDALKDALLPEGLVRIAGSAVEIGPLPPAPEFYEFSSAVVTARLRPSMFASGAVPLGGRELFFRIPGICPMNTVHEFDDPTRSLTSPVAGYSTSVVASGAASMEFVKAYGGYLIRVGPKTGYLATSVSFFSRVVDASGSKHIGVDVVARDGTRIGWHTGVNNRFLSTLDNTLYGDVQSNTWYHVTMLLDWDARVVSVKVDGALLAANLPLPESFESVVSLIVYTFSVPAYLDRIVVACDGGRKPAFSVVPAQCVDPAAGFVTFKFFAGADALHPANDVVAVVDGAAGDCSFARAECAALRACSDTVGVFVATDHGVEWAAGSLASLAGAAEYKLCYYAASAREWLLLDQSFTTCEVVAHPGRVAAGSLASLAGAAEYKLCYYAASAREWLLLDQSFTWLHVCTDRAE
ncbi:Zinc metalloproteinase nas-39 [Diplonema papillatum]|nr:Zinc metalloproteinase nas-39 [Diplonema papillatum]